MPSEAALAQQRDDFKPFEIDARNHAENKEAVTAAQDVLLPMLAQARKDRQGFDATNKELYNIWECRRDVSWYKGRANVYLPAGHRCIERAVAKQMARIFPSGDDCLDVRPVPPGDDADDAVAKNLEASKALVWYDFTALLKIRKRFPIFLRQLNTIGTSPWATDYVTPEEIAASTARRRVRMVRDPGRPGSLAGIRDLPREESGPRGRICDLFTWYVWPATVDDLEDASLVFEDVLVTRGYLIEERRRKRLHFDDALLDRTAGVAPTHSAWANSDRLKERGVGDSEDKGKFFVLTLAYMEFTPPGGIAGEQPTQTDEETGEEAVPFKFAVLGDAEVVGLQQNPWWHQSPPYDAARLLTWVGEFYGRGAIYPIQQLQYQLNDTARQTFDAQTYALNPIVAVDPTLVPDPDLLQYRPAAKWPVPPNAIKWYSIPPTHRQGFESVRQLWETISEVSGAATGGQYLPTLGVAKGAETATGQSLLVAQGDIDISLVVTSIEEDVLEPLAHRIDTLEQQFLPVSEERILRAMGQKGLPLLANGMRIRREQMLGTRTYLWTGNMVSEQREQFQKIGPKFLEIISKIEADEDGRANKWQFIKQLYRSFGFSDADQVIQTPEAANDITPAEEHAVIVHGHEVAPRFGQDHIAHLQEHDAALPEAKAGGWHLSLKKHIIQTMLLMRNDPTFKRPEPPPPQGQPGMPMPPGGMPQGPGGPPMPPQMPQPGMPPQGQPGMMPQGGGVNAPIR